MKSHNLSDAELRHLAWRVLVKHLGHSGALRFSIQTQHGYGDYADQRHRTLGSLSVDDLVERMKGARRKQGRRRPRR